MLSSDTKALTLIVKKCHNCIMAYVTLETDAADQFSKLPQRIKSRVIGIIERLEQWPEVSGAKPLRASLAGRYRIRTGDYRIQFHVHGNEVIIEHIGHRDSFYDERS